MPNPGADFTKDDIEKVYYYRYYCPDGWDSDSETIFRLKNGKIVRAEEGSDSSGHG